MNICLFLISDGWGGAENVVYNLAKFMEKKGHNVNVILNEETYPYFKTLAKVNIYNIGPVFIYRKILKNNFNILIPSSFSEIEIISKGLRFFFGLLLKNLNYRKIKSNILKIVNEKDPDILHFHNPYVLNLYSKIFQNLKCPLIYTSHGKHRSSLRKRSLMMSFDKITAVSNHTKGYLQSIGIPSNIEIIYNGVDINIISALRNRKKIEYESVKNEFLLLFPGGMKTNKGGLILLKAMEIINRENLPISLYYSGSTTTTFIKNNETKNVQFTGFLSHDEYLQKLNNCDCFILLSVIEEFPVSIVEAMALGKAIITTPVGGVPEFCTDGRNALFVERTPEDIAEKIIYLFQNHELRDQISINNINDSKKFDWDNIINKYIDLYKETIRN